MNYEDFLHGLGVEETQRETAWRALLHESAHVVMAALVEDAPATVAFTIGGRGEVHHESVDREVSDKALTLLAGGLAEEIAGFPDPWKGCGPDLERLRQVFGGIDDDGELTVRATHVGRRLLGENWVAVEHFARALQRNHSRLAGEEIERALESAMRAQRGSRVTEDDFERMLRHREIFEQLVRERPREPQRTLWAEAARRCGNTHWALPARNNVQRDYFADDAAGLRARDHAA